MDEEKKAQKQVAADTATAVGTMRKILDLMPTMEQFPWFNKRDFETYGLIDLASYFATRYHLKAKNILTILDESYEKHPKKEDLK